ncbi:MAG: outer membrane protein assembly factor BamE [Gammaproteobacteria bacterium]
MNKKYLKTITTIATTLLLGLCLSGCIRPYKVDVQQGNVLDKQALLQLQIGMSKNQVQDLLGTPVLTDVVNSNQWVYVYTNQINGGLITKQHVELFFRKDKLVEIKANSR